MFENYFDFVVPSVLAKKTDMKQKIKMNLKLIKDRWSDVKDKIEEMPEDEKKIEQPDKILKSVKEIL